MSRLRVGVAMADKGGRPAMVGVEVLEGKTPLGRREWHFRVGAVDRVSPPTVEAARDRVVAALAALGPDACAIVDTGSPQGLALREELKTALSPSVHRPHISSKSMRLELFARFLMAYAAGLVRFAPDLDHRADLDRSLTLYLGAGRAKDGAELSSEDEALVLALCLGLAWPGHGSGAPTARLKEAVTAV